MHPDQILEQAVEAAATKAVKQVFEECLRIAVTNIKAIADAKDREDLRNIAEEFAKASSWKINDLIEDFPGIVGEMQDYFVQAIDAILDSYIFKGYILQSAPLGFVAKALGQALQDYYNTDDARKHRDWAIKQFQESMIVITSPQGPSLFETNVYLQLN